MFRKLTSNLDWNAIGLLVGLLFVIGLFWDTMLVYPVKILVVFFHELSHGLAAIVTGGSIDHIELNHRQGGVCYTRGGSRFITLTAGYLGSLIWGGLILQLAAHTRQDRWISGALGMLLVGITLVFIRPLISFGMLFGLVAGVSLMAVGKFMSEDTNDLLLRVIGLTSCLYAPLDIKSDILDRPHLRSDAMMLAEHTHIPGLVWGLLWITVAIVVSGGFMLVACKKR